LKQWQWSQHRINMRRETADKLTAVFEQSSNDEEFVTA